MYETCRTILCISALGTELGVEIEEGVFVDAPESEQEQEQIDTNEEENDISAEEINFDCPGAGLHPSPTNCADYYQCMEGDQVSSIEHQNFYPSIIHLVGFYIPLRGWSVL